MQRKHGRKKESLGQRSLNASCYLFFKAFIAPTSDFVCSVKCEHISKRFSYLLISLSPIALHSSFSLPFCLYLLSIHVLTVSSRRVAQIKTVITLEGLGLEGLEVSAFPLSILTVSRRRQAQIKTESRLVQANAFDLIRPTGRIN